MSTISDGTTTITPELWLTSERKYESQNRVHRLLSGRVAVTIGRTAPRSGALGFLFATEAAAQACVDLHINGELFQISEPERPSLGMIYALAESGGIEIEQLTEPEDVWMVRIDYQEVTE